MDGRSLLVSVLIGAATSLLVLWLLLVVALVVLLPGRATLDEVLRILPAVLRLLTRLARDPTVPRAARLRLWLLLAYLASPIDVIPDVIPVLGYADDVILVVAVLRSVVRRAGPDVLVRHWTGTPGGLAVLTRLAGRAVPVP